MGFKRSPPLYGVVHGLEGLGSSLQEVLYAVERLHCAAYRRKWRLMKDSRKTRRALLDV